MRRWLQTFGPFFALLLVIIIFAAISDSPSRFLSLANLRIVLAQTVIVAIGAVGMTIIIVGGGIDLSPGSLIALTGVTCALALRDGWSPLMALAAAMVVGGIVGLLNGLVITTLRVVPFIATLGMLGIARGAAKWICGEQTVNAPATWLNNLTVASPSPSWLLVSPGVWSALALAIGAAIMLRRSVFGRHVFALGSNETAARAPGIHAPRM